MERIKSLPIETTYVEYILRGFFVLFWLHEKKAKLKKKSYWPQ